MSNKRLPIYFSDRELEVIHTALADDVVILENILEAGSEIELEHNLSAGRKIFDEMSARLYKAKKAKENQ